MRWTYVAGWVMVLAAIGVGVNERGPEVLLSQATIWPPGLMFGYVAVVAVRHWRKWVDATSEERHDWRGLLPLHVFVIASSYLCFMAGLAQQVRTLFEDGYRADNYSVTFWALFAVQNVGVALGVAALSIIYGIGRKAAGAARLPRK